jgi:hypothetical protein
VIFNLDLPELAAEMAGGEFGAAEEPLEKIEEMDAGVDANAAATADRVGLPAFFVAGLCAVGEDGVYSEDAAVFAGGKKLVEVLNIFEEPVVETDEDAAAGFFRHGDKIFCLSAGAA